MSAGFILPLHSHLPWVLHHGRWPHGSDWLCEAALETYLPLLDTFRQLEREGQGIEPSANRGDGGVVRGRELEVGLHVPNAIHEESQRGSGRRIGGRPRL